MHGLAILQSNLQAMCKRYGSVQREVEERPGRYRALQAARLAQEKQARAGTSALKIFRNVPCMWVYGGVGLCRRRGWSRTSRRSRGCCGGRWRRCRRACACGRRPSSSPARTMRACCSSAPPSAAPRCAHWATHQASHTRLSTLGFSPGFSQTAAPKCARGLLTMQRLLFPHKPTSCAGCAAPVVSLCAVVQACLLLCEAVIITSRATVSSVIGSQSALARLQSWRHVVQHFQRGQQLLPFESLFNASLLSAACGAVARAGQAGVL